MDNEKIVEMIEQMDKQTKAFEKELINLVWVMRGMTLNEAYALSPSQRTAIADMFKDHLEVAKESGLAFF